MGINKFNSEGYYDPVTYKALTNVEREERAARRSGAYRPLVYICSPYAGDVERNCENARRYSRFAVDRGAIPFAPHLLFPQFMSENTERALALFMGNVLLGKCDEIWVFGEKPSAGMNAEIERAGWMKKKIRYFTAEMEERNGR